MLPSNILVALVAPLMGLTQAAALNPKSFITVELYGDYDKHYVEKVWPDGDEHWFSKYSKKSCPCITISFYCRPFLSMLHVLTVFHNRRGRR